MNNFNLFFHLLSALLLMMIVLICVAFLTLLERKVLGYLQLRKGPNKSSMLGFFQPFSDAIKLFTKEIFLIRNSNYYVYLLSPLLSLFLMLIMWLYIPFNWFIFMKDINMVFILCIMSIFVFPMILMGWSSNSLYTLLGSLRSIAQTISYEVSMVMIMITIFILTETLNLHNFYINQKFIWFIFFNFPLLLIFFVSLLAEMNRVPFDFSEGESELVSGFNIEYMSGLFAMIFIAEYGSIMFMMILLYYMFFGGNTFFYMFYFIYMFLLFLILWIRGTFPRFRYDNLMYMCWMSYLPISMNYMIYIVMIKCMNF